MGVASDNQEQEAHQFCPFVKEAGNRRIDHGKGTHPQKSQANQPVDISAGFPLQPSQRRNRKIGKNREIAQKHHVNVQALEEIIPEFPEERAKKRILISPEYLHDRVIKGS